MTDFERLWDKSGTTYASYSAQYPQYIDTNKVIVELARIVPGQTIVDLGSGTGLTAQAIGERLQGKGKIYCLDFAEDMLTEARQIVDPKIAEFITVPAEEIDRYISKPVDRVVCNAAMWQFRDIDKVLSGIVRALKPDGRFVFSLPQQFYDMPGESHRGLIVKAVFEELKARGYDPEGSFVTKFTEDSIRGVLSRNGLTLQSIERRELRGSSLEDGLAFFAIPAVSPFFENVPEKVQQEVLRAAGKKLKKSYVVTPNRWAFITALPR